MMRIENLDCGRFVSSWRICSREQTTLRNLIWMMKKPFLFNMPH